jgi:hypothetical protein
VTLRLLRATRLAHLAQATDPILVAETFGVRHDAATRYLATPSTPGWQDSTRGRTHER